MQREFVVSLSRFHRKQPNIYVVQGYFKGNSIAGSRMRAMLDREELPLVISVREGLAIRQKYFSRGIGYEDIDREYDLWISLPADYGRRRSLSIFQELDGKRKCVFRTGVGSMKRQIRMPDGYLETFKADKEHVSIGGWAVGNSPCRFQVLSDKGQRIPCEVTRHYRQDIVENYPELTKADPVFDGFYEAQASGTQIVDLTDVGIQMSEEERLESLSFGYEVTFARPASRKVTLIIGSDRQKESRKIDLEKGLKGISGSSVSMLRKGYAYLKRNGLLRTIGRVKEKVLEKLTGQGESYMVWRKHTLPTPKELEAQTRNVFLNRPLISIVVPLYRTPENYLRELVDSVRAQTYGNWELCLSDGSGDPSPLEKILKDMTSSDERIRVISSQKSLGISENTNEALHMAVGEYIVFADHDDLLPPNALYECMRTLSENPDADLIYSDEDKVSMNGKTWFEPHFKSDFNIDLLRSMNYFCHLVMVSRKLYAQVGDLDPAFDGAQDYDFVLRCVEKARKICHIPKVLYHWRSHTGSTSENPQSKMYAFEAGMRAVQAHYDRLGIDAKVVMGEYPGLYRTYYRIPDPAPLISIIIPNKDHIGDLDKCVSTIYEKSTYPHYEFVVVENNSTQDETFAYYREMEQKHDNFHVYYWEDEFNYSLINNFGAEKAKGDYLLFLNNDTQIICEDCLEELLGPCLRSDVGAVGARLLYADNTIQHAGVIMGYGGIAGHAFQGFPGSANGYFSRIICQSDLSAVTAACMMVRRSVFEESGGFDPILKVAFNDIDFCLRLRSMNYLVVYNPYALLYHYESKSRGMEDTPGKISRFNQEADELLRRWPQILKSGDPYYNPNLSLDRVDFGLKKM